LILFLGIASGSTIRQDAAYSRRGAGNLFSKMKPSIVVLSWLVVPVAAATGFFGSWQRHAAAKRSPERVLVRTGTASTQASAASAPGLVATWTTRLAKCKAEDLPGLYDQIQLLPDRDDGRRAMLLLFARWAELDAPGGLAFFTALEDKDRKSVGRVGLLTEWAVLDPLAVFGMISQQPEKEAEADITNIGHNLLMADPDQFWVWFKHARRPLPWSWGGDVAWQCLAATHFEELSAIATELMEVESKTGDPEKRHLKLEALYQTLATAMAEKNPDQAVEWAKLLPESVRNKALIGALEVLVKKSPERIPDYLNLLKSKQVGGSSYMGSGADALIEKAVRALVQRDAMQTLDWLRKNYEKLGENPYMVCRLFGEGLADALRAGKMSPEQAFAAVRAAKEQNGAIRSAVLTTMWQGLPADQLATTAKWLTTIESKDAAKLALEGIFPEWIKQDQAGALAFAATLKDKTLAAKMFDQVARASFWGHTSPEKIASALKLIPFEYRAEIIGNQVRGEYEGVPADFGPLFDGAAICTALEDLPSGPATEKAYTRVAAAWAVAEPETALTWAIGQSDSALRKAATGAAVEAWAKEDAWGTSQWIEALPAGETRDTASDHLARSLRKLEPASAWTWAGTIGDRATRLEAQAGVLREWLNTSAGDAAAAVHGLSQTVPPADHQRLVEALVPVPTAK
jgi:hypothetical protein